VPKALDQLGLPQAELTRHIGWDIGALDVAIQIADRLDAPLVSQEYSRLVIDCNRRAGVVASVPQESDGIRIPRNQDLSGPERRERERSFLEPYHQAISEVLDERGEDAVLIPLHSFTPVFAGVSRPWHISLMSDGDPRLHQALLERFAARGDLSVGDNEPYRVEPVDYTIPVHGTERGLLCSMIEIRQDLISIPSGQAEWAEVLSLELPAALSKARAAGQ